MVESEGKGKSEKNFRLLQEAASGLGVGLSFVCDMLEFVDKRLSDVEAENTDLKKRVFDAETYLVNLADRLNVADLKAGVVATSKLAEASFEHVPKMAEVSM